jgi:uncharacterized protein (TIGR02001 family)
MWAWSATTASAAWHRPPSSQPCKRVLTFAHTSGVYVGAWASNVSWIKDYVGATDGTMEIDLYGGYKGEIAKDLTFDIGVITYQYPGNTADKVLVNANTTEVYGALTFGIVTAKYSQSTGNFIANPNSSGSGYFELAATFDLGGGFTLTPHVGRQTIPNQERVTTPTSPWHWARTLAAV